MKTLTTICAALWIFAALTCIPSGLTADKTAQRQHANTVNDGVNVPPPQQNSEVNSSPVVPTDTGSSSPPLAKSSNGKATGPPELTRSKSKGLITNYIQFVIWIVAMIECFISNYYCTKTLHVCHVRVISIKNYFLCRTEGFTSNLNY